MDVHPYIPYGKIINPVKMRPKDPRPDLYAADLALIIENYQN